jgi:hypothetical protein
MHQAIFFAERVFPAVARPSSVPIVFKDELLNQNPSGWSVGAERPVNDTEDEGGFRTSSPMLLPENYETFLPLSPTIRDGDIMVGSMMERHAQITPRELPRFILHTVTAGSQWGGEANLLKDTTVSNAVQRAMSCRAEPARSGRCRRSVHSLR